MDRCNCSETIHRLINKSRRVVLRAFVAVFLAGTARADNETLVVFAAASTTDALSHVAEGFTAATGIDVVLSLASSGGLSRQIEHGAPADVFISANPMWTGDLLAQGLLVDGSQIVVASNRLVLIVPAWDIQPAASGFEETLFMALGDAGRLVLGDPAHVPAGLYAREVLEHYDLWSALEQRLARTSDVRVAVALVARREAPAGLVYATDAAITDEVAVAFAVPADRHGPILNTAGVVNGGNTEAASAFIAWLAGPESRAAFEGAGFLPP